jgi:hypothetical protein
MNNLNLRCRVFMNEPLPVTEQLLVSGGDARIAIDPVSHLNKYGCQPFPDPALLDFGSSTASVISQAGFAAANSLRERLLREAGAETLKIVCAREMQRIRRELLHDVSDLGVRLVFATSGTDAHFIAALHAGVPLTVVMVEEAETGSGVAAALSASFCGKAAGSIESVSLRAADGMPRPLADIDAEVSASVERAVMLGRRVLLIMVDQSKTGMIAPSPACVMGLHQRYPDQVSVLVDACQFRIAKPTLRAYLQQGFMVALTGSKFLTGPSFSAVLLLPEKMQGLPGDDAALTGEDVANVGLLLRWEAALVEWRRFGNLPQSLIVEFMEAFAKAVQQRLNDDPRFEFLPAPQPDRRPLIEAQSWDHLPSIFPFLLYRVHAAVSVDKRHPPRTPLNREETQQVYRQLQVSEDGSGQGSMAALRCQLGQPVACGVRSGIAVSALRLCISARLISDAAGHKGIDGVIDDALLALDKTVWLIDRLMK